MIFMKQSTLNRQWSREKVQREKSKTSSLGREIEREEERREELSLRKICMCCMSQTAHTMEYWHFHSSAGAKRVRKGGFFRVGKHDIEGGRGIYGNWKRIKAHSTA